MKQQNKDLCIAIDELIDDIQNAKKYKKTYKQMKMYHHEFINSVSYRTKK